MSFDLTSFDDTVTMKPQDTHLASLAERLREPRVRAIIEPMLAGRALGDVPADDLRFVQDLGLVQPDREVGLVIANPIYRRGKQLLRHTLGPLRGLIEPCAPRDPYSSTEGLAEAFEHTVAVDPLRS